MSDKDTDAAESDSSAGDAEPDDVAAGRPKRGRRRFATLRGRVGGTPMLAVLLVALVVAGGYAWWQVRDLSAASTADNLAHVETTETARVEAEITRALETLFSYDHELPELAQSNADELLRGDARDEWDTIYQSFEDQAVGQDLMLASTVRRVGVRELSSDTADVVVFMDQTSARAGDESASLAAAQLAIAAEHHDGAWRITEIDLL